MSLDRQDTPRRTCALAHHSRPMPQHPFRHRYPGSSHSSRRCSTHHHHGGSARHDHLHCLKDRGRVTHGREHFAERTVTARLLAAAFGADVAVAAADAVVSIPLLLLPSKQCRFHHDTVQDPAESSQDTFVTSHHRTLCASCKKHCDGDHFSCIPNTSVSWSKLAHRCRDQAASLTSQLISACFSVCLHSWLCLLVRLEVFVPRWPTATVTLFGVSGTCTLPAGWASLSTTFQTSARVPFWLKSHLVSGSAV